MIKQTILPLILVICLVSPLWALDCIQPDAQSSYEDNTYVFSGSVQRITSVGELPSRTEEGLTNSYTMAVMKVKKVYKGRVFGPIKVYANNYWGEPFEVGDSYIIYANLEGNLMVVPDCSATMLLSQAADQIEILEEIRR